MKSNYFNVDIDKVKDKAKYFTITQNPRLWASLNLSRYQRVQKMLNSLDCILVSRHLSWLAEDTSHILGFDVTIDENIIYLVLSLKYCDNQELSDLSTSFGKFKLKEEFKEKYKMDRLNRWLYEKREHTINGSEEDFLSRLRSKVDDMLNLASGDEKPFLSLKEFVLEFGLWGTSGSLYGIEIPKELKKYIVKNKWSIAGSYDLEYVYNEVLSRIESMSSVEYKTMEKEEATNVRYVVVADIYTYIAESYLSYFFEHKLSSIPQLFNYHSNTQRVKFWEDRRLKMIIEKLIAHDIDYSGWDENVNLKMIETVIYSLRLLVPDTPDTNRVYRWLKYIIFNTTIDGRLQINGLASGRRWTTLINSLINAAIQGIAADLAEITTIGDVVLGDDADALIYSERDGEKHLIALSDMGFSINFEKSKTGVTGEFLKTFYNKRGIYQSPYRLLRSLLFSTEDERLMESSQSMINARLDSWMKLCGRLVNYQKEKRIEYNKFKIGEVIIYDFIHLFGHKIKRSKIVQWLVSPSAIGGGGISFIHIRKTKGLENYENMNWVALNVSDRVTNRFDSESLRVIKRNFDKNMKDNRSREKLLNNYIKIVEKSKYSREIVTLTRHDRYKIKKDEILTVFPNVCYAVEDLNSVHKIWTPKLPRSNSGYYTASLLNLNDINLKMIREDYRERDFIVCNNGEFIGKRSMLTDTCISEFIDLTRGKSNAICDLILKEKLMNIPRELLSFGGEVSSSIYWIVLSTFITNRLSRVAEFSSILRLYNLMNYLILLDFNRIINNNILNTLCMKDGYCSETLRRM